MFLKKIYTQVKQTSDTSPHDDEPGEARPKLVQRVVVKETMQEYMQDKEHIQRNLYTLMENAAIRQTQDEQEQERYMGCCEYDIASLLLQPGKQWKDRPFFAAHRIHLMNEQERKAKEKKDLGFHRFSGST